MWYLMGASVIFEKWSDRSCSIKSKNNSTKGILNLLEFSHIIFTYTIEKGVTVVKLTKMHLRSLR